MAVILDLRRPAWMQMSNELQMPVGSACGVVENALSEAALSLAMFDEAFASPRLSPRRDPEHQMLVEAQRVRARELESAEPPPAGPFADADAAFDAAAEWRAALNDRAKQEVLHAHWATGALPRAYRMRLPFLHAKGFVVALDRAAKGLRGLARLRTPVQGKLVAICDELDADMPQLRLVRDSAAHPEDRAQRKQGIGRKPIPAVPQDNQLVVDPIGAGTFMEVLQNRQFGGTVEGGDLAWVDVTAQTLLRVRDFAQRAFDTLPPKRFSPWIYTPTG
jgi:hypothetical protein